MKDEKTEFRYFSIMEYEKEQEYLRQRHKEGWKFSGITFPLRYHFVKCEPEDVVYQLDYNPEGIKHKDEYVQMFQDCGWEYLMDFVGYSYFRKPAGKMKNNEEIFCDDASRLEMMRRIFRGKFLPLLAIFCCIIIPQMSSRLTIGGPGSPLFIMFTVLFILYAAIFIQFAIQYRNYKKRFR